MVKCDLMSVSSSLGVQAVKVTRIPSSNRYGFLAACALGPVLWGAACASGGVDSSIETSDSLVAIQPDSQPDLADPSDVALPAPPTPGAVQYGVGVYELTTPSVGGRTLPTTIWYPIPLHTAGAPVKYLNLIDSPTGAIANAPPLNFATYPLVVFSHGNQGIRQQSVFLTEALAQRGFVVAAPDHVGNTFFDYDGAQLEAMAVFRPLDITAVIDRVVHPSAADPDWLKTIVDGKHIAVSGHSFGGYTALAVAGAPVDVPAAMLPDCATATSDPLCLVIQLVGKPPWTFADPRVSLVLPLAHCGQLDSFGFMLNALADIKVPAVIQAATGDSVCPYDSQALPLWKAWPEPKALISLQGGNHFSYSDLCSLPAGLAPQMAQYCVGRKPDLLVAHEAVVRFAVAAANVYLRGLDSERAVFAGGGDGVVQVQSAGILK